jgi:hypothetical protein
MSSTSNGQALYENLDTAFVNLWSLLRNLTHRGFVGRVRVELADYSADVFLNGSPTPLVHEVDRSAGTDTLEESGLHRVVVRARKTPGKISVFQETTDPKRSALAPDPRDLADGDAEYGSATPAEESVPSASADGIKTTPGAKDAPSYDPPTRMGLTPVEEIASSARAGRPDEEPEPATQNAILISLGGELIQAVERGVNACGEDFAAIFNLARLELSDDYSFLDPMTRELNYADGVASVAGQVTETSFVTGLSEVLRRVVDKVAVGDRKRRLRERIALELLGVARKRKEALEHSGFRVRLDQIAGTKVI